jgi:hypothetical protein
VWLLEVKAAGRRIYFAQYQGHRPVSHYSRYIVVDLEREMNWTRVIRLSKIEAHTEYLYVDVLQ